jgi:tetratricopeptide (TPR) repeat protein
LIAGTTSAFSLEGKAGIGKTTLAIELAYHKKILEHFEDGILWTSLGPTPQLENEQAIWAKGLGLDPSSYLYPEDKKQAIKQTIADRKMLLVIDDVWKLEDAELFRCGGPNCVHFLTTRHQDIARKFASAQYVKKIEELTDEYAYTLLKEVAPEVCTTYPQETRALSDKLGGLPLAINLVGAYLSTTTTRYFKSQQEEGLKTIGTAKARLEQVIKRLGDKTDQAQNLTQIIGLSLETLDEASRQAFYALGAFAPKPDSFSLEAAKAVTEVNEDTLSKLLDILNKVNDTELLAIHQVLADVAGQHTPEAAHERHAAYYLAQIRKDREAWQHIQSLYPQIIHAANRLKASQVEGFLDFMWSLGLYHERRGLRQTQLEWYQHGLVLVKKLNNRDDEAIILGNIGMVYDNLGQRQQALEYFNQALAICREVGDRTGEATTLNNIGGVYDALGQRQKALEYYNQALSIRKEIGDREGEAIALNNIGMIYNYLGQRQEVLEYYNQALSIMQDIGSRAGEATALNNIGMVYVNLGQWQQALERYNQALSIHREVGNPEGEAVTRLNLADIYQAEGDLPRAITELEQGVLLAELIQHPDFASYRELLEQLKQELGS